MKRKASEEGVNLRRGTETVVSERALISHSCKLTFKGKTLVKTLSKEGGDGKRELA